MVKANPDFARTSAVVSDEGGDGADTGPYEHQLADHKWFDKSSMVSSDEPLTTLSEAEVRKILTQIGKAFEAQHGKKPKADQLRNLITARPRACTRRTAADVSATA